MRIIGVIFPPMITTIHYNYTCPKTGKLKKSYVTSSFVGSITHKDALLIIATMGIGINPTFTSIVRK